MSLGHVTPNLHEHMHTPGGTHICAGSHTTKHVPPAWLLPNDRIIVLAHAGCITVPATIVKWSLTMLNVVNGRSHLARMRISWGSYELNAKGHTSCAPKVTRVVRHFTDSTRVGRGRRQSYSTAHPRTRVFIRASLHHWSYSVM